MESGGKMAESGRHAVESSESALWVTVDDLASIRKCTHGHTDTGPGVSPGSDTRHSRPDSGVWCVWCVAEKKDTMTDVTVYYKTQCV